MTSCAAAVAAPATRGKRPHHLLHPLQLVAEFVAQRLKPAVALPVAVADSDKVGVDGAHVLLHAPLHGLHLAELVADLGELVAHAFALLLVPGLLVIVQGRHGVDVPLQGVMRGCQAGEGAFHLTNVLHHLGEALKVDIGVIGWHAGVGFDGVLPEALGLQLTPPTPLGLRSFAFLLVLIGLQLNRKKLW